MELKVKSTDEKEKLKREMIRKLIAKVRYVPVDAEKNSST